MLKLKLQALQLSFSGRKKTSCDLISFFCFFARRRVLTSFAVRPSGEAAKPGPITSEEEGGIVVVE